MFCVNCGAENANEAKFCHSCGKPLVEVSGEKQEKVISEQGNEEKAVSEQGNAGKAEKVMPAQVNATNKENGAGTAKVKAEENQLIKKLKAIPKLVIAGACAAIVALIVIICVVANAKKTINLNDYVTIEATGYDGYGTVRAYIDWDAIETKYGSKVSFTSQAKKEYGGMISLTTPVEIIEDCVSVKLDTTSGLKNGDKISYTWKVDEDLSDYVKCKLKYKDAEYSVSGLEKVGTFDAFADLEVTFTGTAPNGRLEMDYNGSELSYYSFSYDKYDGLKNGDIVTITIDNDLEYCARDYGRLPEYLEKEYKVEGLESYVSSTADISDEGLAELQKQATDVYNSYVAKNWDDCVTLQSFTYIGNYLLTAKNSSIWGSQNILYLVYKVQAKADYTNEEESYRGTTDVYWFIEYTDLIVDSNGELLVDITDYDTPGYRFSVDTGIADGWWSTKQWTYYGYESLDILYKDIVTSNVDSYNHEDNVDESLAPVTVIEEEEEQPEETEVTEEPASGFIFANSDTELLTEEEIEALTADECEIALCEIYARHGCIFADEELQAYFESCEWYEGTVAFEDFDDAAFSDIELTNRDLLAEYN